MSRKYVFAQLKVNECMEELKKGYLNDILDLNNLDEAAETFEHCFKEILDKHP